MKPLLIIQRLRRNPVVLGLSVSAVLLIGLLLHEAILNRFTVISREEDWLWDFGTAIVSVLLTGYLVGAYYAVLRSTRNTLGELELIRKTETDAPNVGSPKSMGKKAFFIMGLVGAFLSAATNYLTIKSAWAWSMWKPETW